MTAPVKYRAILRNYNIIDNISGSKSLEGSVFGHPKHGQGKMIRTSKVLKFGEGFAETVNTVYKLEAFKCM